jgi:hypothetical protein
MANKQGLITANPVGLQAPETGETDPTASKPSTPPSTGSTSTSGGDTSLPDPTSTARWWLTGLAVAAVGLGVLLNALHATAGPFKPSDNQTANFALFAGFYVGAQVIERVIEVISPLVPQPLCIGWTLPADLKDASKEVRAVQVKADRAAILHGLAALLGVAFSCAFGLFFLAAVGMQGISHTIDAIVTGFVIAGGVKPLHDFISYLQNRDNPTTTTGTSASS